MNEIGLLRPFVVPMRLRFRRVTTRAGVLLQGPAGWGEFSPFPDYGPAYTSRWLAAAQEAATVPFPTPVRDRVPVNTTVPAVDPERAFALVAASGCRTAKVKVAETGQDLADDLARVSAVRDALGPDGRVRVDANGAWDVESAVLAVTRLDRAAGGLEYVEQPCATLDELRELRRRVDVPLAADESVRTAEDPLRIAGLDAADVLVVKVQPLGGVHRALEVIDAAGLPTVVSSALETSVGLAAGVALAAALPELPYACGLGTGSLLAADVTDRPLLPQDGTLPVRRVAPDPAMLDQAAPDPELTMDLLDRLQAAATHLAAAQQADDAHQAGDTAGGEGSR
ncbi:o-succinylbenzoate synthase [Egicoccus sp. AB-alg2]|uniref:o-succinylbenzoate synthase n=1 Tax=Egicoccus sp. AB-alg2 TaxID=3242693 RepID=UPI00359E83AF